VARLVHAGPPVMGQYAGLAAALALPPIANEDLLPQAAELFEAQAFAAPALCTAVLPRQRRRTAATQKSLLKRKHRAEA
jgi:hypothetical protein